jgi:GxxExxY protein
MPAVYSAAPGRGSERRGWLTRAAPTGASSVLEHGALTERLVGLAIGVHEIVGPGFLSRCTRNVCVWNCGEAGIEFESQVIMPVVYKGRTIPLAIPMGFRADIVTADAVIIEVKAVAAFVPAHRAQLLTFLRMSKIRAGLLMNFHAPQLKEGLLRCVV